MSDDTMTVEILEDGTLKVVTDPVSAANHASAEQFLQFLARLAGGDTQRVRRSDRLTRVHQTDHVTERGGTQ